MLSYLLILSKLPLPSCINSTVFPRYPAIYPIFLSCKMIAKIIHNSYVIVELAPSSVIFWTELSCWRKSYL